MVREELARGVAQLQAAGVDTPRLDAELLMCAALGVTRAQLVIDAYEPVSEAAVDQYAAYLARRAAREPVAYVLGHKPFRRLSLRVDPRVLIPRPETELLVDVGLELPAGSRVIDVGTGSGALALALADERPDLIVTGIDVSADALVVARANGEELGLDVRWVESDLLDGEALAGVEFDAVLANLPYVEAAAALAPEIAGFEPTVALSGGADGLDLIRRLVTEVAGRPEVRLLGLEIGFEQGEAVAGLVADAGFVVERVPDLARYERVIIGRR